MILNEHGGYILHKESGRQIPFVEREGVYFIKMKILGAKVENSEPGFGRQGP